MSKKRTNSIPNAEMNIETAYHTTDGLAHPLKLRPSIPFVELGALVNDIAGAVVNAGTGYQPYLYEYAYWGNLLGHYTDFDLSSGVEQTLDSIRHSDLVQILKQHISAEQLAEIDRYTADLIEYRKSRSAFDGLCSTLNELVTAYGKKFAKALKPRQLEKILSNLSGMTPEEFRMLGQKVKEKTIEKENK